VAAWESQAGVAKPPWSLGSARALDPFDVTPGHAPSRVAQRGSRVLGPLVLGPFG
jgi:hypothetical protein